MFPPLKILCPGPENGVIREGQSGALYRPKFFDTIIRRTVISFLILSKGFITITAHVRLFVETYLLIEEYIDAPYFFERIIGVCTEKS